MLSVEAPPRRSGPGAWRPTYREVVCVSTLRPCIDCGNPGQGVRCRACYRQACQPGSCQLEGCQQPHYGLGLCRTHWRRQYERGATGLIQLSAEQRFWQNVDRRGPDDCWPWRTARANGYGPFWIDGQVVLAHRFAYELLVGLISDDLTIDHRCHSDDLTCPGGSTCRHRRCVNPAHLEPVTGEENNRRGRHPVKTHCPRGHPYSGENVVLNSRGVAECRICRRFLGAQRRAYARATS